VNEIVNNKKENRIDFFLPNESANAPVGNSNNRSIT
jgi:hypothetical protein